jgi:hypothetical protein
MAPKRCPRGFVCTDWGTVGLVVAVIAAVLAAAWFFSSGLPASAPSKTTEKPQVIVVQSPPAPSVGYRTVQHVRPDLYPEPVQRLPGLGFPSRTVAGPYQQVGIITAEGGSSGSAAPDRTILPLYGRELDARRGKWQYYTRTDGTNPVQVPVRVRNRVCDDDTNGCDELFSDDSVHVPSLGRSFKATVYRKSLFT